MVFVASRPIPPGQIRMAFSYFFRDLQTLEIISAHILPTLRTRRYINIWSAGCARGQEPYTIALMLRENMGTMIFRNVKIYATDLDPTGQFGKVVTGGRYPIEELKRMPRQYRKYFSPDPATPGHCRIADEIRRRVEFHRHNLLDLQPVRTNVGLIVCKNVLLHFTEQERSAVIRMFYDALGENGFFLTEHTQRLPQDVAHLFERIVPNAQVFRKAGSV